MHSLFLAASAAQSQYVTREAAAASRKASEVRHDMEFVKADIEKLLMLSEALWTLLKEQHGYTDEELVQRVQEIDLRDGKLDGKVAKTPPSVCPACERTLLKKRPLCLYCGEQVAADPFQR